MPDVNIGRQNSVHAKKQEKITSENEPNPWYSNKKIISYYIGPIRRSGDYMLYDIVITFLSDVDDKYHAMFEKIISTVRYK